MFKLSKKYSQIIKPVLPFNFTGTVHNPSHFSTPTEIYEKGKFWQTMRFEKIPLGIKLENKGSLKKPQIKLTIYSQKPLKEDFKKRLIEEIEYRFELNLDLSEFNHKFKNDKVLGPVIKRWLGMRSKCGYSLYESLMIYIVLQNATVRRTIQMMEALLKKYGEKIKFDGKELYGIGPAALDYLLFEVFHRNDAFDTLSPWEQKIYSRLLYNKPLVCDKKIMKDINQCWGEWKKLATHYLWTDLFWRHKQKPIDWLAKEIRV